MKVFAGIDPGLDGAVALVGPDHIEVFDMPTFELKGKRRLDLFGLARFFDLHGSKMVRATIEEPNSMPGQGVASMFKFGFNCGVAQMAAACSFIPTKLVKPAAWKGAMGLSADKDASRALASRMFPKFGHLWARKRDDGRAESVLLAIYGSKLQ